MIEVFKTDIKTKSDAYNLVEILVQQLPGSRVNFDLHDCDKILRVEGNDFSADAVVSLLTKKGFNCEILE
jgi:hypothetical protein